MEMSGPSCLVILSCAQDDKQIDDAPVIFAVVP